MIHRKSVFRLALAAADAAFGLALVVRSGAAYGGSPALAVLGFLFLILAARVLGFMRLRALLACIALLGAATFSAALWSGMPLRETAPIFAGVAAALLLNLAYVLRLAAPRP